jgi:hypothetical protein
MTVTNESGYGHIFSSAASSPVLGAGGGVCWTEVGVDFWKKVEK